MKLNLLPQTVSKGRQLKTAWAVGILLVLLSAGGAIAEDVFAHKQLSDAEESVASNKQAAADALATSQFADQTVAQAADVIRDANLAQAMIAHNDVYPKLYGDLRPYIPSFFRINSIAATPNDAESCTVTLVGTVGSYEQYADLVLALMRFKDAKTISRTGYNYDRLIVPGISEQDLVGTPRRPGEQPIPTDQMKRLAYFQQRVRPAGGYLGVGGYGTLGKGARGATPTESLVTIVMTVSRNLQVPSVESTLASAGSGAAAGGAGATGFGGAPAGMTFGGPPPGSIPGGAGPRGGQVGGAD